MDLIGAALHLEDDLAHERLVVLLAQHLVAGREVGALLHLEPFEGGDQLVAVVAALEAGFLDAELDGVHRLEIRLDIAVGQRARQSDLLQPVDRLVEEGVQIGRVERRVEYRHIAVDADKPLDLVAERRQLARYGDRAVAGAFVFLGKAEIIALVDDVDRIGPKKIKNSPSKSPLIFDRNGVMSAVPSGMPMVPTTSPPFFLISAGIGVAGRLAPRIVGKGDLPLLAHLVDEIGRERLRLRRGEVEGPEGIAVALAGRQRRVEAHADHVDDLVLDEDRRAGEADIRQIAADMDVDLVLGDQLLDRAASGIGLRLVVGDDQLDRPAEDAAGLVDAVDRHLQPDQRRLAAQRGDAGQRLLGADPVGLLGLRRGRRATARPPRRPQRGGAARQRAAARDDAPVSALVRLIVRHLATLPCSADENARLRPAAPHSHSADCCGTGRARHTRP